MTSFLTPLWTVAVTARSAPHLLWELAPECSYCSTRAGMWLPILISMYIMLHGAPLKTQVNLDASQEQQAAITWPLLGPSPSRMLWHALNIQQPIPSLKQTEVIFSDCQQLHIATEEWLSCLIKHLGYFLARAGACHRCGRQSTAERTSFLVQRNDPVLNDISGKAMGASEERVR